MKGQGRFEPSARRHCPVTRQARGLTQPPVFESIVRIIVIASYRVFLMTNTTVLPWSFAGHWLKRAWLVGLLWALTVSAWAAGTVYVSLDGTHAEPYNTWATAATNIQTAVDYACANIGSYDTVLVSNGFYYASNSITPTVGINITEGLTVKSLNGREATIVNLALICRVRSSSSVMPMPWWRASPSLVVARVVECVCGAGWSVIALLVPIIQGRGPEAAILVLAAMFLIPSSAIIQPITMAQVAWPAAAAR